jgi:tetratricopeptide (TPR) repeat protein
MIKKGFIPALLLLFVLTLENNGQDLGLLLKEAQQHEAKFNDKEALLVYSEILKFQPNNLPALCKSSELHALLGRRLPTKEKQKEYYKIAKSYAQQALRINPNYPEANFVMAFAMGRIAILSSGEERIKAVKEVKIYAEKTIQLDPMHYKAYHVLAKWHYEISDLNSAERWLLKMVYGSLPESSLEMSIRNYEKSRQLNPAFLLNYLELAKAYNRKGDKKKAIALLNNMMKLPFNSSNDATIKSEGKRLLENWK